MPRLAAIRPTTAATVAALMLTLLPARSADAEGPVHAEIALMGGWAAVSQVGPTNPFGLGAGGRAGLSLYRVYLGVEGMDYAGTVQGWSALQFSAATSAMTFDPRARC